MEKNSPAKNQKKNSAANDSPKKHAKKDFLCVGLGASAGGVKALQNFFSTMPPNSGMAFVVILHLAPDHESNLANILQTQTQMPVIQVNETHKVEPNHVYVIPPSNQLEMVDGVVRCKSAHDKRGSRVAIDVFFRTLAAAYERNGVCVILSGTGSDGTLGLKTLKEANGFAIVQDPNEAEYDGMPRSAIATGLVDWVLPVAQMPEKLINFKKSSERLHLTDDDPQKTANEINAEDSLREILAILRVRTGHDFSNYKTPTLVRRIARHLQIHELEDIPTYLNFLRDNPDEILSLQRNLLINVTNFFRDKSAFERLEAEVIPQLFAGKSPRETVRIWSAGCASGEEAYSLAILLSEYADKQSEPPRFQIFATDVDDEAISEAREGDYPHTIEADVTPERLKRFFVHEGNRYRVKKEIREKILFAPHNILRDPPFSKLNLIACRNVLIYLNRETQDKVMEVFHFALSTGGYLFLGSSESADGTPNLFAPFDKKLRIYSRRSAMMQTAHAPILPVVGRWQANLLERRSKERDAGDTVASVHYKMLEKFAPPSVLVNQDFDVMYMSESVGRYLRFASGEPTNNLLKLVHSDLLADLRAALFAAQREGKSSVLPDMRVEIDGKETFLNLYVRSADLPAESGQALILIVFNEQGQTVPAAIIADERKAARSARSDNKTETVISRLEEDLARTRSQLRATIEEHEITIEELKASNEELQAINEELRSAGEELETSKEELQSVNEELTTVNHELKEKIDETSAANSDLQNLMAATEVATIFLDRHLNIKRYTPPAQRLFNITPFDVGRPLEHFTNKLEYASLGEDATEVLRSLKPIEREISGKNGRHYLTHFLPYRTTDDRIAGAVLNFVDITDRKRREWQQAFLLKLNDALRFQSDAVQLQAVASQSVMDYFGADRCYYCEVEGDKAIIRRDASRANLSSVVGAYPFDSFPYFKEAINDDVPLVIQDSRTTDQLNEESRRFCIQMKMISFIKVPVVKDNEYVGNLCIAQSEPRNWADFEVRFAEEIAERTQSAVERARAETAVSETEERLTLAASVSGFGIHDYNVEQNKIYWSPELKAMHGLAPDAEITSETLPEMFHPDDREWVKRAMDAALDPKGNGEFEQEFRAVRQDTNEILWLYNRSRTTFAGKGKKRKPIRNTGVVIDITERKRAEEALSESEARLRLVMESVKDYAIFTIDSKGFITDWNPGAQAAFGWTEKEALGQNTSIIFTPEDLAKGADVQERATAIERGRAEDERWHMRKDGTRFYVSGILTPFKENDLEGFVKIARDQTDRIKTEKAIQEKETLTRLVAAQESERRRIARDIHDHFGQQLTALRLKLDSVRKICKDRKIIDGLDQVQAAAVKLDADVDFIAWELRPAALDDLGLRVTLSNFVREWAHHTEIETEFHTSGLGKARLSYEIETNLYRIAQEALNNIYKHAKAKNVSVLLEKRKDKIVLIIEDDGTGFNVADKKTRRRGIGLSGMEERARILGGELEIESEKDAGTTVFARVPFDLKNE